MPETTTIPQDIQQLSFEDALKELEQIVEKLDSGRVDLDQSIDIYTRGSLLKQHCEEKLRSAQDRVEKIVSQNGTLSTEPTQID
ncbi:exodeoxyribonuclease VII small subunit [Sneathiella glossodoripedis]|uniref:exodeoxyribonuclease VII small subunit n=1 Tax=Sneathiella glossodoripedis TaxID=418853 RepID=UPI00047059D1|nr:exodeoxyribonuclease VII small subunit [Sneathiella glossodoripedis]